MPTSSFACRRAPTSSAPSGWPSRPGIWRALVTYSPTSAAGRHRGPLAPRRRMAVERHDRFKVIAGRALLEQPQATMGDGMLDVADGRRSAGRPTSSCARRSPAWRTFRSAAPGSTRPSLPSASSRDCSPACRRPTSASDGSANIAAILSGAKPPSTTSRRSSRTTARAMPTAPIRRPSGGSTIHSSPRISPCVHARDAVNPLAPILGFGERVAAEIARTTGGL